MKRKISKKRKVSNINTDEFFEAIAVICKEYNEKHKSDPIIEVYGHFKFNDEKTSTILRSFKE